MSRQQTATILSKHDDYNKFVGMWTKCRDVAAGEEAVHKQRELYLPRLADQDELSYNAYLARAGFFNATYRTVDGLRGMIFRRPPKINVPATVTPLLEDVDLQGTPFLNFLQDAVEEALIVGKFGLLVDYPQSQQPGAPLATKADTARLNLRPTLQMYRAEDIFNWRTTNINNKVVLSHVVLREEKRVPVDEFADKCTLQYRVLDLGGPNESYRQRVFQINVNGDEQVQIGEDIVPLKDQQPLDFIPFFVVGTCDEPPLLDLININLGHYRVTASYEHGCHFTGCPTPVVSGYSPADPKEKLYIGSTTAWIFKDPQAKASFLEFAGQGLTALKDNLTTKEQQMAVLGARMLEQQKRMTETAEVAAIHRSGENSMLAAYAQMISTKIEDALEVMAWWCGATTEIESDQVEFGLNTDFYPSTLSPQELAAVMAVWQGGGISKETFFDYLQDREIVDHDTTYEDEEAKIEAEGPKLAGGLSGLLPPPGLGGPPHSAAPAVVPPAKPKPTEPPVKQPTNAQ